MIHGILTAGAALLAILAILGGRPAQFAIVVLFLVLVIVALVVDARQHDRRTAYRRWREWHDD